MAHHIFQLESELQNIPEAAPKASPSFSVSEKLARYGSTALSALEDLTLLVGKESIALALMRHFGSLKALSPVSFLELRQFLPQQKAETVIAALSMSAIAETEHAVSDQLDRLVGPRMPLLLTSRLYALPMQTEHAWRLAP